MTKTCTKCFIEKDIELFSKSKRHNSGYDNKCRQCDKEYKNANYLQHFDKTMEKYRVERDEKRVIRAIEKEILDKEKSERTTKKCCQCKRELDKSKFYGRTRNFDGLNNSCKKCDLETNRIYQQNNSEKIREKGIIYRSVNSEKVKIRKAKFGIEYRKRDYVKLNDGLRKGNRRVLAQTLEHNNENREDLLKLFDIQNNQCLYCSCDLTETKYHLDHIHPLIKGGSNLIYNLCLACPTCNLKKGSKDIESWCKDIKLNYQYFLSELNLRNIEHFS